MVAIEKTIIIIIIIIIKLMFINKGTVHLHYLLFGSNGNVIEQSVKVKYMISLNDTDDNDMMRQMRQLYAQGNVMSRV